MADIETRADCERLVRAFYGRALDVPIDALLWTGPPAAAMFRAAAAAPAPAALEELDRAGVQAVGADLSTDVTKLPAEEQARIRKMMYNQRARPVKTTTCRKK